MLQVINQSPFSPAINLFPDEFGVDALYIVIKATFTTNKKIMLAPVQVLPHKEDEYWGGINMSSLKYMSDMHLGKVATDIVVNSYAHAPYEKPVTELECGIKVAEFSKTIKVFGNRYWQGNQITAPEPFVKMPLIYENAFGGAYVKYEEDAKGNKIEKKTLHLVNPLGRGYRKRGVESLSGEELPNLENPKKLIVLPSDQPEPVGFGFLAATWQPRVNYAGTYDKHWQKKRAPYLPVDFNRKFFSAACKELIVPAYLKGGETVMMVNLSKQKHMQFELPQCELECQVKIAGKTETPSINLETVLFEPGEHRFLMTWRAKINCDKKSLKISEVKIMGSWNGFTEVSA